MNATTQLHGTGQRLWLDNITKALISSGTLAHYINDLSITAVTSNPTILEKAISGSGDYDEAFASALVAGGDSAEALVFAVALEDLVAAADLLRPIFDASASRDGYVSVEVSPDLVDDTDGTVSAGRNLFAQADRPNVMIKVPGTPAGLVAVEELIAAGIPVNVTLLFSDTHYLGAADAYLRGVERRLDGNQQLPVGSVSSVFVSRWDAAADPHLPEGLHGKTALAVMQRIFTSYQDLLSSERWKTLASAGALPQKVLWASTGTKNPALPDTYYLDRLAAPGTVDTIPEATLLAFADHGVVCDLLEPDTAGADAVLSAVKAAGVDVESLAATLQADGAGAFRASWADLLGCVARKARLLGPAA
jgi:transaldolase